MLRPTWRSFICNPQRARGAIPPIFPAYLFLSPTTTTAQLEHFSPLPWWKERHVISRSRDAAATSTQRQQARPPDVSLPTPILSASGLRCCTRLHCHHLAIGLHSTQLIMLNSHRAGWSILLLLDTIFATRLKCLYFSNKDFTALARRRPYCRIMFPMMVPMVLDVINYQLV